MEKPALQLATTEWFDDVKPARVGPYERDGFGGTGKPVFTYWGGEYFGYLGDTPEEALKAWTDSGGRKSYHQHRPWRGVVHGVINGN